MRNFSEFFLHLRSLNFAPETIIDVGVSYGTPEIYDSYPDAYYILVEPLDELEERLKLLCKKLRAEYHLLALSDYQGEASFFVPDQHDTSSLKFTKVSNLEKIRKVKVDTLDHLLQTKTLKNPVLLKTDCQGSDIDVIKGATNILEVVDMIIMESQLFNVCGEYKDNTVSNMISYMYQKGFVVYDFIHYKIRPFDGALGQINIAFVKEDSDLRKFHNWQ